MQPDFTVVSLMDVILQVRHARKTVSIRIVPDVQKRVESRNRLPHRANGKYNTETISRLRVESNFVHNVQFLPGVFGFCVVNENLSGQGRYLVLANES